MLHPVLPARLRALEGNGSALQREQTKAWHGAGNVRLSGRWRD